MRVESGVHGVRGGRGGAGRAAATWPCDAMDGKKLLRSCSRAFLFSVSAVLYALDRYCTVGGSGVCSY